MQVATLKNMGKEYLDLVAQVKVVDDLNNTWKATNIQKIKNNLKATTIWFNPLTHLMAHEELLPTAQFVLSPFGCKLSLIFKEFMHVSLYSCLENCMEI